MRPREDSPKDPRRECRSLDGGDLGPQLSLGTHETAWREKGLLRRVYLGWYHEIQRRLSSIPGPTIELGSGIGRLKEVVPDAVLTDVERTPYADAVADAEKLPFTDGSVANLVLVDVFHHLAQPARFLGEAQRVLAPGGRVVLLEPYCSPLSRLVYEHLHEEELNFGAPALGGDDGMVAKSPWTANIALPTLVFFRRISEVGQRFPELVVCERRRLTLLAWPLSGGYSRRPLAPGFMYRPLELFERLLAPLLPIAAFRCLVVLERR